MNPPVTFPADDLGAIFDGRASFQNMLSSALLVVAVLVLRTVAVRVIRRTGWLPPPAQLRWRVHVRWIALLLLLLGLVVVWATELRTLAISFVAFAVALVLATKELILCVLGSVVRASSGSFRVGDLVEIGGARGEVIDLRPLTTTLLEIGPTHQRTGRTLVLPNSLFLTALVANETMADEFVLDTVTVPLLAGTDWREGRRALLEVANEVCEPYLARARHDMDATALRHGLMPLTIDPAVTIQLVDGDRCNLHLRVPTPARERASNQQKVIQGFLERSRRGGTGLRERVARAGTTVQD